VGIGAVALLLVVALAGKKRATPNRRRARRNVTDEQYKRLVDLASKETEAINQALKDWAPPGAIRTSKGGRKYKKRSAPKMVKGRAVWWDEV
jgi:hypothetical protein